MKTTLLFLMFAALVTAVFAAEPFTHAETGITLPEKLGGMMRGEAEKYGSPGEAAVAIPYRTEGLEVTIFIRRVDPKKVPTAVSVVEESMAAVKQMQAAGAASAVKIIANAADDPAAPGWAKGSFAVTFDSPMMSHTYATIKGDHVIKLRISTPNPKNDSIPKFVAEFQKAVNDAKPKR